MTTKLPPFEQLLHGLPDMICVVDVEGHILYVNAAFESILAFARDEVVDKPIFDLVHPDDREATMHEATRVNAGSQQRHFRNRYLHRDGHAVDIRWSAHWLPEYRVRVGVGREVTDLRRSESALEHLANHDSLTGLSNRHHLQAELQRSIADAQLSGEGLTVLYLDLDGFKTVNDQGGHVAGDHLLCEAAQRMQHGLRQGDLVARIGGDEFVALLPRCRGFKAANTVADGIRSRLNQPYDLSEGMFHLDASIGIACYPEDGIDPESLLAHADSAMYAVKRQHQVN